MKDQLDPHSVPVGFCGAVLGITARQLQRLVKDGVLPAPTERGFYDLPRVVEAWFKYLSREKTGDDTLAAAKLDFWRARARREGLETDELAGNLLAREEVRLTLGQMASELGSALDGLAPRVVDDCRATPDQATARSLLAVEFRKIRERMADAVEGLVNGKAPTA